MKLASRRQRQQFIFAFSSRPQSPFLNIPPSHSSKIVNLLFFLFVSRCSALPCRVRERENTSHGIVCTVRIHALLTSMLLFLHTHNFWTRIRLFIYLFKCSPNIHTIVKYLRYRFIWRTAYVRQWT